LPSRWPDNRLIDLFEIEHPIILAAMVGAMDAELAAGGVGGRRAWFAAMRNVDAGSAARPVCPNPRPDRQAGQREGAAVGLS